MLDIRGWEDNLSLVDTRHCQVVTIKLQSIIMASVGSIRARFEQAIAQNETRAPVSGGMYLSARLSKQKQHPSASSSSSQCNSPAKKSSRKSSRPPTSPKKTIRSQKKHCQTNKGCTDSVTSRTVSESESDTSGELKASKTTVAQHSPKLPQKEVKAPTQLSPRKSKGAGGMKKRSSICRHVEIPQSIDEEKEEMVGCTIVTCDKVDMDGSLVLNFDDEAGFLVQSPRTSPRKGSMVNMERECNASQGSTLSRSSPQIRRLPRDLDFDSDDSSMSDDDSEGLVKHRQMAPKPRFW